MQKTSGVMIGPDGVRVEWWGIPLQLEGAQLEVRVPLERRMQEPPNLSQVGLDGDVALLQNGRVQLSAGSQKGVGPVDGWIVDTATGYRIAWRGTGDPIVVRVSTTVPTLRFLPGGLDYLVAFNPHGLTAWEMLKKGEVVLDALPPKSRQRRFTRALLAGAKDVGNGLLMWVNPDPVQWPPLGRNRSKGGKQHTLPWDERGHNVTSARRRATRY